MFKLCKGLPVAKGTSLLSWAELMTSCAKYFPGLRLYYLFVSESILCGASPWECTVECSEDLGVEIRSSWSKWSPLLDHPLTGGWDAFFGLISMTGQRSYRASLRSAPHCLSHPGSWPWLHTAALVSFPPEVRPDSPGSAESLPGFLHRFTVSRGCGAAG